MTTDSAALPNITWDPPDAGEWSLETAHGSEIHAVPTAEIMAASFGPSTRSGLEPFGLPLSHAEMHYLNGWPYFSFFLHDVPRSGGKPPPDFVLKLITRLHPGFRRRTKVARRAIEERRAQQIAAQWFAERDRWIERLLDAQDTDTSVLDDTGLADHVDAVLGLTLRGLSRHFELIFASIPLGKWFARCAEWGLPAGEARTAVMHGTPIHEEARRRLDEVVATLDDARPQNLDGIRAHGPQAAAALEQYLRHHGRWATGDDLRSSVLADHPDAILAAIDARRSRTEPASGPATVLAELRERVPAEDRAEFDRLATDAHETYKMLDDNSGILGSWSAGLGGSVLRQAANRLAADGRIADCEHVWALPAADTTALLRGASTLSPEDVSARYSEWCALAALDPPRHLGAEPSPPPDPGVFPAPVAELMRSVLAFIGDKFNEERTVLGVGDRKATGRAVVVEGAADALDRIEPGDILVTVATTPAYNTVLAIAGGVVVTEGGPSSHTAVVARELGIPAIVGCHDALDRIPDGAVLEIDPASATVNVLSRT